MVAEARTGEQQALLSARSDMRSAVDMLDSLLVSIPHFRTHLAYTPLVPSLISPDLRLLVAPDDG